MPQLPTSYQALAPADLARRILDEAGPFPHDSWLREVAATGLPPTTSLAPLIPDPFGQVLLDQHRRHLERAEQLRARLSLDHLFRPRVDGDTVRILHRDDPEPAQPSPREQLTRQAEDALTERLHECLVFGKSTLFPRQEPPEHVDVYALLDEAQALIGEIPPAREPVKIRASQWAAIRARDAHRGNDRGRPDGPTPDHPNYAIAGIPVDVEPDPMPVVYDATVRTLDDMRADRVSLGALRRNPTVLGHTTTPAEDVTVPTTPQPDTITPRNEPARPAQTPTHPPTTPDASTTGRRGRVRRFLGRLTGGAR